MRKSGFAHPTRLEAPAAVRNTPWWYSSLINIERLATSDTAQEHSAMVAEGLRRHPAYYPIFFEHTVDLTSKAGADTAALAQFAKQAGNSAQDGQSMYARIYWYADWSQYRGRLFIDGKAEWPLMRAAFDDLLRRYPSDWNKSGYAYFACVAGDQAVARRLLAELGPRVSLDAWSAGGQSYLKKCQRWANPAEKQDGITL
ncbi:hypothetical protein [Chitinilyticum litopenaei]|uniref:hypothetical protein n=1 Tax=Chitinilyticum litopenaei TaxID=1121276 RepID=UPI001B7FEC69|nr:hypothetical protein [Chitinilyticum litopenaei]